MIEHELPGKGGISSFLFAAFAFLLPFFFIPSAAYPFQFSKVFLALVITVIVFIFFSVHAIRTRIFSAEWSWLSVAFLVLPAVYLISSIFSSAPSLSFVGYQLDSDTFGFIALASALALATTLAINTEGKILSVLLGLLVGGWVVLLFQALQIFFGVPIHLGLFTSPAQNLIGTWNDFGLFASLIASLVLLSLETLSLSPLRKGILAGTLLLSLVLLAVVNFSLAWILLGAVSFMTLIFSFMRPPTEASRNRGTRGIASVLALATAVFFVFFGAAASASLQTHFSITSLDVSPSFQATISVIENTYAKSPFFGSGPNTFANQWFLYRPAATLSTIFWSADFSSGVGYIPTALATGGIVVGLGWLFTIIVFLWMAIRALLSAPAEDERSYFLLVATAAGSAFLLVAHFFYDPSAALTLILFLFLGLFIASLRSTRFLRSLHVSFAESPRLGFVSVLVIAILLVLSLVSVYKVGEVYAASVMEGKVSVRSNANDLPGALAAAEEAVTLHGADSYLRTLTQLQLSSLNALLQSGKTDDATRTTFQNGLAHAIDISARALAFDSTSYANWMNRASVYEAVVPLGITGAADNATAALESARKLNPASPEVDYQEANLKAFAKDNAGAKASAQASIAKKADYTPAILLLAQIALNEGNLGDAISSLKSAIVFTPNDSSLLYELGLLELQDKQYQAAADAFHQALAITPDYANAKFFLGEADIFLGNKDEATTLFESLQAQNPDNATLEGVLEKLQKGQNPFATSTPAFSSETTPAAGK